MVILNDPELIEKVEDDCLKLAAALASNLASLPQPSIDKVNKLSASILMHTFLKERSQYV